MSKCFDSCVLREKAAAVVEDINGTVTMGLYGYGEWTGHYLSSQGLGRATVGVRGNPLHILVVRMFESLRRRHNNFRCKMLCDGWFGLTHGTE